MSQYRCKRGKLIGKIAFYRLYEGAGYAQNKRILLYAAYNNVK